jgi:hypothetical protein
MKIQFLQNLFKLAGATEKAESKDELVKQSKTGIGEIRDRFETQSSSNNFFSGKFLSAKDLQEEQNYHRPEPKDDVLVAFEAGETRSPYVTGNLWSDDEKPPETDESNERKSSQPPKEDP